MKGLLFTYLLTYGGAVASFFNPYIGLLIYVCFSIIRPESLWHWSVTPGSYSRVVALALFISWAVHGFGNWNFGRGGVVVAAFVGYWIWTFVSAMQADNPDLSMTYVESLAKIVLPFVVGMTLIDSVQKLKQLAWVILLSQGYVAYDFNLAFYGGFNKATEDIGFGGMDNNCIAVAMVTGVGLALFMGLHAPVWWQKVLGLVAALLMAHVVMFAFSRGGMLGLCITGLTAFLVIPKKPKHYLLFALVVAVALRLAGPDVTKRFSSTFTDEKQRDASAQSRVELWAVCWTLMQEHPVFGVGPSHFGRVVHRYGPFPVGKLAHTLWLQVGAEVGFPGLGLLLLFYGLCVVQLWPLTWKRYPVLDPWHGYMARMVIASLAGFAVAAQFVSLQGLELPYYVTLLGAGVLKLASAPAPNRIGIPYPSTYYRPQVPVPSY